jgi:AraC-like DNA-binding protein
MATRESTKRNRAQLVAAATVVIERDAHLTLLSLERTADDLGVSPREVQRAFRDTGTTYRATVEGIRMERAAVLLRETLPTRGVPVQPIREVAAMVGYNQPAGFAKAFRRYHGRPPHQARSDE